MSKEHLCYKMVLESPDGFSEVVSAVDDLAEKFTISPAVAFKLTLALDEIISNIFNYAFTDEAACTVEVVVCVVRDHFYAKVTDKGVPFDVSTIDEPELDVPLEERIKPVGGMGIHLVRKMMDSFTYYRHDGKNTVIICSKLVPDTDEERS
ncbi:MAG: ATP-binding protein [Desulfovibrionales bacterium]|nr:ATP-binding protein [Desulfovibrionales bacterium]